ncbi:MAG TPA: hypothetical protein VIB79_25395 [Candidatus Binatia bacterium]|jgi:hypothetical protein
MIRWSLFRKAVAGPLLMLASMGAAPSDWVLVGKDGECLPVSILQKKGPEFRGVEDPYRLAEKMRSAGHKAEIKEHTAGSRPAVEVRVPDMQLYVMFMKADVCRKPTH